MLGLQQCTQGRQSVDRSSAHPCRAPPSVLYARQAQQHKFLHILFETAEVEAQGKVGYKEPWVLNEAEKREI